MTGLTLLSTPSPNWDEREGHPIDLVVLHYTGMASGAGALRRLTDPDPRRGGYLDELPPAWRNGDPNESLGQVSAHYLVETDGRIFALVPEDKRAWHAGVSSWEGETNINQRSIGIEIVNGGHDWPGPDGALPAYTSAQIEAVIALVSEIAARHAIPPERVVGHSDVAPDRKRDPGEHFPWDRLGCGGAWPCAGTPETFNISKNYW